MFIVVDAVSVRTLPFLCVCQSQKCSIGACVYAELISTENIFSNAKRARARSRVKVKTKRQNGWFGSYQNQNPKHSKQALILHRFVATHCGMPLYSGYAAWIQFRLFLFLFCHSTLENECSVSGIRK